MSSVLSFRENGNTCVRSRGLVASYKFWIVKKSKDTCPLSDLDVNRWQTRDRSMHRSLVAPRRRRQLACGAGLYLTKRCARAARAAQRTSRSDGANGSHHRRRNSRRMPIILSFCDLIVSRFLSLFSNQIDSDRFYNLSVVASHSVSISSDFSLVYGEYCRVLKYWLHECSLCNNVTLRNVTSISTN